MSSNSKVKGLLKGLRFISQIFDSDDKDSEIQISNPTDVKHVAHIGWDGQGPFSENNPSWMNEFKSVPKKSSESQNLNEDTHSKRDDNSVQRDSEEEGSMKRGSGRSQGEEKELPKTSKRNSKSSNSTGNNTRESQAKEKSDRPRPSKKLSNKSSSNQNEFSCNVDSDSQQQQQQGSDNLPTKKYRPKISKDGSNNNAVGGGSSKSRSKTQQRHSSKDLNSKTRNKHGSFEREEAQFQRGSSENMMKSYPN